MVAAATWYCWLMPAPEQHCSWQLPLWFWCIRHALNSHKFLMLHCQMACLAAAVALRDLWDNAVACRDRAVCRNMQLLPL
jgi:hypothetical protein